jgi:death on curing protein
MILEPRFLLVPEVLYIHDQEILISGGSPGIRDMAALESALGAPLASINGSLLMNIFEMAATYLNSIAFNHPFVDGNKRTALATMLTFLFMNGYEVEELYHEELADKTLELLAHKISKSELAQYLKIRSKEIQ